jgi:hypothetical protein
MSNTILEQVNNVNYQIKKIDDELALMNANPSTNATIIQSVNQQRNKLNVRKTAYTTLRQKLMQTQTNNAIGFNSAQQTIIDQINTKFPSKYTNNINKLKNLPTTTKVQFFNLYTTAETDYLKEMLIKTFNYSN